MDISTRAQRLVADLASTDGHLGYMSCAVYDTAWVAMVAKPTTNGSNWLFPQCFEYLLKTQQPDGAWPTYGAQVDGVLNSAAALLALKKHANSPLQLSSPSSKDLDERISRGTEALGRLLGAWDVDATVHVGFEYLVPTLLNLLADECIQFDFPGRAALMAQNNAKMSKFKPEFLYSKHKLTAIHSLEAFYPSLDYSKVRHHKAFGAMMASPSSTAAYLMSSSPWDDESEKYLNSVLQLGAGQNNGGVPSAFPSTYFEVTWVLTTLLKNGYAVAEIGIKQAEQLAQLLSKAMQEQDGLLGFAPTLQPDVDDTAKTLTALSALGHPASPESMLQHFEEETHFKTYHGERNPSFSANCNVLVALLSQPNPSIYQSQIIKIMRFLTDLWWESDGWIEDKWNLSAFYSTMLMVDAFTMALKAWDVGDLPSLSEELIRDRVVISLFQALVRTLQTQNEDGSWGTLGSKEEASYAVSIIAKSAVLPFAEPLHPTITKSLEDGKNFIVNSSEDNPAYLWVEKVSYGSKVLEEAYVLAALKAEAPAVSPLTKTKTLVDIPMKKVKQFTGFYAKIPLFAGTPSWKLQAALIEGYLFLPQLRRTRLDIFPRENMEDDKYFEYIPFTWTAINNLNNTFMSGKNLHDMMVISFLNYQADEFMEAVVGRYFSDRTSVVLAVIDNIFAGLEGRYDHSNACLLHVDEEIARKYTRPLTPSSSVSSDDDDDDNHIPLATNQKSTPSLGEIRRVLKAFITHVMQHPAMHASSALVRAAVKTELRTFLLSHMEQASDNDRYAAQADIANPGAVFNTPRSSFYRWVQSTSSDHTSCPYSFMLYQCILGDGLVGRDCFPSTEEKYVSEAMCRHLAVLCRMYNDYGSLRRDREEKNVNSLSFPDFHCAGVETPPDETALKAKLFTLADYERSGVERAFAKLQSMAGDDKVQKRTLEKVRVFINVTDLYGQIYVARDIASRM